MPFARVRGAFANPHLPEGGGRYAPGAAQSASCGCQAAHDIGRAAFDATQKAGRGVHCASDKGRDAEDMVQGAEGVIRVPFRICHLPEDALRSADDTLQETRCALQKTCCAMHCTGCAMHLTEDVKSRLQQIFYIEYKPLCPTPLALGVDGLVRSWQEIGTLTLHAASPPPHRERAPQHRQRAC